MKRVFLYILGAMFFLSSCIEEQPDFVVPASGEDVKFCASLNNVETRTIYGDEVYTKDNNGNLVASAVKVKWVNGDLISIYGADCLDGRKQGEYKVTAAINEEGYSYASNLERASDAGVQWGNATSSKFYAIYPAVPAKSIEEYNKESKSGVVAIPTTIRREQKNVFSKYITYENGESVTTWVGTPYVEVINENGSVKNRTMQDALMYASSDVVTNSSESVVNLKFTPFATVLKFKLEGWGSTLELDNPVVYVQSINLVAPEEIAGECVFTFDGKNSTPTVTKGATVSNIITIKPTLDGANFLPLERGQHFEFNVFVIPDGEKTLNENWSVELVTTHGNFKYRLKPTVTTGGQATIKPGKIHKINIPQLTVQSEFKYSEESWVESIPRNVYLTELSVPGAWNCGESAYQGSKTFAELYKAGVRAFHIDCRASQTSNYNGSSNSNLQLVCARTESSNSVGKLVKTRIGEIVSAARNSGTFNDEYIVIVLTIAGEAYTTKNIYGQTQIKGTINPNIVLPMIAKMLGDNTIENSKNSWPIYGYTTDTKDQTIHANTTVNDVLGKVIVLVNTNIEPTEPIVNIAESYSKTLEAYSDADVPKSMVTFASLSVNGDSSQNVDKAKFFELNTVHAHWGKNKTNPLIAMLHHFAERTVTNNEDQSDNIPSLETREKVLNSMTYGYQLFYYNANGSINHGYWCQLGIGGYVGSEPNVSNCNEVASRLNTFVLGLLNKKLSGGTIEFVDPETDVKQIIKLRPSPMGIVLMNQAANQGYSGGLIKAIVDMNGKFYLERDQMLPAWPSKDINQGADFSVGIDDWETDML